MATLDRSGLLSLKTLFVCLALSGCASPPSNPPQSSVPPRYGSGDDDNLARITYDATDLLLERSQRPLDKNVPVLVATFVNIDKLDQSSSLGRIMAEAISDRLTQLGYYISEVKLRGTMMVKENVGQLMLSRDLERIRQQHNAQAVVAGTYAVGLHKVHVSLKLINTATGQIISAMTYYLKLGPDTRALLGPS